MADLDNISIVLVRPKTPGNIGAVARCMMNTRLSRLVLVDPPEDRQGDAVKLAAGAGRILETAEIFHSLREAVADQGLVIGTSRHAGRLRKNIRTPRSMAEQVLPLLGTNKVALVFGNEVNGLEQTDLSLCHEVIAIPSDAAFPSLNLSHAVMVVAYELLVVSLGPVSDAVRQLAPQGEVERFYEHLQETLQKVGFLERDHPERIMVSLRQLFGRARLDHREVSILRGILTEIQRNAASGRR
ncbi:MAG: hypothetical protein A2078_15310 [Nitrospirae bacterium GWC2_57_9]|nr:MAG: hypothetical protein A2078_15310 [Nitrospirae bacterium GWC2_57_9]